MPPPPGPARARVSSAQSTWPSLATDSPCGAIGCRFPCASESVGTRQLQATRYSTPWVRTLEQPADGARTRGRRLRAREERRAEAAVAPVADCEEFCCRDARAVAPFRREEREVAASRNGRACRVAAEYDLRRHRHCVTRDGAAQAELSGRVCIC
jgi:hypothetical protein